MSTENRPAELKKLPVAPSKYKAREILQKCGLTFRRATDIINEEVAKFENVTIEEAKKMNWYINSKVWKDLWTQVIYEEDLFRIGYKL